jgi:glycosyltransferase involved in cell wall biosynthesis
VSDVPPEKSFHGSVLLHRLLENYPTEKLVVIEGNLYPSSPERRLPDVRYETLQEGWPRPLYTRFAQPYRTWLTMSAASRIGRLRSLLRGFEPQAVLTVAYYYAWITAANYAKQNELPLHLILHDEYVDAPFVMKSCRPWLRRKFGSVYRQAASRLCVSPYMAAEYQQSYGAKGEVLYPGRASDAQVFSQAPERLLKAPDHGKLVVAFGGTIGSSGGFRLLSLVARALQPSRGVLVIFGPVSPVHARASGLGEENVVFNGALPPDAFKQALREQADVLLATMNFDSDEVTNARISFPSKLADYTSVGLPILILGPKYCSGVRWAEDNAPVAEVVTRDELSDITAALEKLSQRKHRLALANAALQKGDEFFRHDAGETIFLSHLCAHNPYGTPNNGQGNTAGPIPAQGSELS